jgi:DNA-binding MarR family transcriptional regulator
MSSIMRKSIDNVNDVGATPGASADAVMELVHTVMHRFRSLQYRALRDAPAGMTHMEGKALGYFTRHPGATLSELAQHSGRDKAQLARLVKALRERGLLEAEADAGDRRNVRLAPSAAGLAVQRTLRRAARTAAQRALAGLDEREQAALAALLARVDANLAAELGGEPDD